MNEPLVENFLEKCRVFLDKKMGRAEIIAFKEKGKCVQVPRDEKTAYVIEWIPEENTLRIGFRISDRWISEKIEQAIEDSGDSMDEFLELGLDEAELEEDFSMLHFHEDGIFYFSSLLKLKKTSDPELQETFERVCKLVEAYRVCVEEAFEEE